MDIFSIDVTHNEIAFMRQALDLVTISGKDAKFLANLQTRLEQELAQIDQLKQEAEQRKAQELQALLAQEEKKASKKSA